MARLIYALLALAAVALVAGFLVSSTNLPLLGSIAFSAIVSVLILYGNSRRLRREGELFAGDEEPAEEMEEIVEVDEFELAEEFGKPSRTATTATKAPSTTSRASETTRIVPPKRATPKRKPATKKAPSKRAPSKTTASSSRVKVIPGRSKYHRAGCRFAKGDDVRTVTEVTAKRRGYLACSVCFKD